MAGGFQNNNMQQGFGGYENNENGFNGFGGQKMNSQNILGQQMQGGFDMNNGFQQQQSFGGNNQFPLNFSNYN
jgi:hypothetical protein